MLSKFSATSATGAAPPNPRPFDCESRAIGRKCCVSPFFFPDLSLFDEDAIWFGLSLLIYVRFCTSLGKIALGNAPHRPENPGLIDITPPTVASADQ